MAIRLALEKMVSKFNWALSSAIVTLFLAQSAFAITCAELDGAYVVAQDGTYLGFFGNSFASESINNQFGSYGSQFSSTSVRNQFGSYGSQFGLYSANNSFASSPPEILKNGFRIGYLTTNSFKLGGVSLETIDASCSFFSSSAVTQISSGGTITTAPSALTGLIASDGTFADIVFLSWNFSTGATSYDVYVATEEDGERQYLGTTQSQFYEVSGIVPGQIYYFFVFPVNSAGSNTGQYDSGYSDPAFSFFSSSANQLTLACIQLFINGEQTSAMGYDQFGLLLIWDGSKFTISGIAGLTGKDNCAGSYEATTRILSDRIQVGDQFYDVELSEQDDGSLLLTGAVES